MLSLSTFALPKIALPKIALPKIALPKTGKMIVAAGALAVLGSLGTTAPAAAQWGGWGHHEHWRGGWGPRPFYRPYPVYRSYYVAPGPNCFVRRKWVPGPFGWHWASRRICTW